MQSSGAHAKGLEALGGGAREGLGAGAATVCGDVVHGARARGVERHVVLGEACERGERKSDARPPSFLPWLVIIGCSEVLFTVAIA